METIKLNENQKYHMESVLKSICWEMACKEMFGFVPKTPDEVVDALKDKGRQMFYEKVTLGNQYLIPYKKNIESYEEYVEMTIRYKATEYFTDEMLAVLFEPELKADWEKYCRRGVRNDETVTDNHD